MNSQNNDRLDGWLDSALRQYGNAEPRPGLPNRILAALAVEKEPVQIRARFAWGLAIAGVAVLAMVVGLGIEHRSTRTKEKIASDQVSGELRSLEAHREAPLATKRSPLAAGLLHSRRTCPPETAQAASEPRQDQFPSARPLSKEELLFVFYAQQFPREALLIAEEQQNFEKEIQQAEQGARNTLPVSDTDKVR